MDSPKTMPWSEKEEAEYCSVCSDKCQERDLQQLVNSVGLALALWGPSVCVERV